METGHIESCVCIISFSVCVCVCVDLNVHKQLKIGSHTVVEGNRLNLTEQKEMR